MQKICDLNSIIIVSTSDWEFEIVFNKEGSISFVALHRRVIDPVKSHWEYIGKIEANALKKLLPFLKFSPQFALAEESALEEGG